MGIRRHACLGLPVALWLVVAGCTTHERYIIPRAELEEIAQQRAQGIEPVAVPATREKDGKQVFVRTRALRFGRGPLPGTELVSIEARAKNRMVTAGSVLTWIGTAISLVGTGLFAAGRVRNDDGVFVLGAVMTLGAEPIMWTGTGLWIGGAMRRPYEMPTSASTAPASTAAPP